MIYTANQGIANQLKPRLVRSGAIVLPLLAIAFIALSLFTYSVHRANGQNPDITTPATGGKPITATTSGSTAPSPNGSGSTTQASSGSGSGLQPASTMPLAATPSTGGVTGNASGSIPSGGSGGSSPVSGGLGGGGLGSGGSTPTPTVACTNLLSLAQICTACTPPITLQPGQKALLSVDGTCIAAN